RPYISAGQPVFRGMRPSARLYTVGVVPPPWAAPPSYGPPAVPMVSTIPLDAHLPLPSFPLSLFLLNRNDSGQYTTNPLSLLSGAGLHDQPTVGWARVVG